MLRLYFNPSNAEVTIIQSIRMQRILKNTLSCWYTLDSSNRVLSDEYPYAMVLVIIQVLASFCIGQDFETVCPNLANVKIWGHSIF